MGLNLDSLITSISSGFATAQTTFNGFVNDARATNTNRPRISAINPVAAIDKVESLNILNFPHDRPKYYMTFAFEEYRRPSQFEGLASSGLTDYICLPLPNNLQDRNTLNWNPEDGAFLGDVAAQILNTGMDAHKTGGLSGATGNLLAEASQGAIGIASKSGIDFATGLADLFGGKGAGDSTLQLAGIAENPFQTVAFKGPTFKTHSFSWRLSPKSQSESATVKKITDTFKKVAYPELLSSAVGGFYRYPMIAWLKIQPDAALKNMYTFKPCVITMVNINYTPNDRPGFYGGTSAPVEVGLEISFTEIELWRGGAGGTILDGKYPAINNGDFNDVQSPPVRNLGSI